VVHTAEVGKETFEADIKLALPTGRILSASAIGSGGTSRWRRMARRLFRQPRSDVAAGI